MGLGVGESDWDRAEKHYRQALQADKTDANWVSGVHLLNIKRTSTVLY